MTYTLLPITKYMNDLSGQTFSRLTVIGVIDRRKTGATRWLCVCVCGTEHAAAATHLVQGKVKSCGCLRAETGTKDNPSKHPLYRTWISMKNRCNNPNYREYHLYGGAGVKVCKRWADFAVFVKDMGDRPSPAHTVDRYPDNSGNYQPNNTRWATAKQQSRNRRDTITLTLSGVTLPLSQWAEGLNVKYATLWYRKNKLNWSDARTLNTPENIKPRSQK